MDKNWDLARIPLSSRALISPGRQLRDSWPSKQDLSAPQIQGCSNPSPAGVQVWSHLVLQRGARPLGTAIASLRGPRGVLRAFGRAALLGVLARRLRTQPVADTGCVRSARERRSE